MTTLDEFVSVIQNNTTNSQNYQDLWALFENKFKRDGFFVEFGATDGVTGNNTLLLEREYGWTGILAEPNPHWHNDLFYNRNTFFFFFQACELINGNKMIDHHHTI